jgi:hypothetical protein
MYPSLRGQARSYRIEYHAASAAGVGVQLADDLTGTGSRVPVENLYPIPVKLVFRAVLEQDASLRNAPLHNPAPTRIP